MAPPGGRGGPGAGPSLEEEFYGDAWQQGQREQQALRLKADTELLRVQKQRWDELYKAGTPRKVAAAADRAYDAQLQAIKQAKDVREAGRQAFADQKALELSSQACAERLRRAEEAARRIEEKAEAAERLCDEQRCRADAAASEGQARLMTVADQSDLRIEAAEREAAERRSVASQVLSEAKRQSVSEQARERNELERRQAILEARAEERREKMRMAVSRAQAAFQTAEAKRDRQVEAAEQRSERSSCAANSKVRLASGVRDAIQAKASMRIENAQKEGEQRLAKAKARENNADADLRRRQGKAGEREKHVERRQNECQIECERVETEHQLRVLELGKALYERGRVWEKATTEAEMASKQRVSDVRALADILTRELKQEVALAEAQCRADEVLTARRVEEQQKVLGSSIVRSKEQAAATQRLASGRIAEARNLIEQQVEEMTLRTSGAVAQAKEELASTREVVDGRISESVSHLMTYLSDQDEIVQDVPITEHHMSLELWVPLPGTPDDV